MKLFAGNFFGKPLAPRRGGFPAIFGYRAV